MMLRASAGELVVARSPLHARMAMSVDARTRARDEARAVHRLTLGVGAEIEIIDAADYRGAKAREARDSAVAEGRIPLLAGEVERIAAAAAAARALLPSGGIAEQRVEWTGPDGCACVGTPDVVVGDLVIDIKCIDCDQRAVRRGLLDGWATQLAAYREATGATRSAILAVEIDAGVAALYPLAESMQEYGARRWDLACRIWARCVRDGVWPGPSGSVIDAPAWAMEET